MERCSPRVRLKKPAGESEDREEQKERWWKIVDTLLCRFGNDLRLFFAYFLLISSVFTEQSQKCVKNVNPNPKERWDPLWEGNRVPHSCQVWSRQKCLWIVMTRSTKIFYYNNMKNELRSCHNKINRVNFVWMQDFWILLKLDSISWLKTLEIWHNFMQWPVVNTLSKGRMDHHNQEDGSTGTRKLGPYRKLRPVACMVNMELRSEFGLWTKDNTHSWVRISHGSNGFVVNLNNNEQEIPEVQLEE